MVLGAEQIKPRSMSHRISADKFPVVRPLPCGSVGETVGVVLREGDDTVPKIVKSPVCDSISQRALKLEKAILIKLPDSNNLPVKNVLRLEFLSPSDTVGNDALPRFFRN